MHDRDWYHDRRFHPPGDDGWRLFRGLAVIAVAVVLVLVIARQFVAGGSLARLRPSAVPSEPAPTDSIVQRTTYRCVVNGRLVYVGPKDCDSRRPEFDLPAPPAVFSPPQPATTAPAPALTEYQREMLRSADARIARDAANARADMLAMHRRAAEARASGGTCAALQQEIDSLDAWARQPLSGAQQDQIRARRAEARSRQAELHC